jgi:signal transduction histidine kinase
MSELAHLNRISAAGELSASIAHEVSQPLTSIAMSTAAALHSVKAATPNIEKAVAALTRISNESARASEVVANLRSLFRRDTQKKGPVELNKVILSVLRLMEIELEKDQIEVHTWLDDGLPTVIGSEVQLRQVVLNLVMNARDAMRSAPFPRELRIKSERIEPDQVQVSIEDSGPGISDLEQIFQPMFTTKSHGMGMGLSICRSIVEAHKGRIWAAGGSEIGSTFRFSLPGNGAPAEQSGGRQSAFAATD